MLPLFRRDARIHRTQPSTRGRRRACLQVESLEPRTLLSIFAPGQIQNAYGFNQISFLVNGRSVTGNGSGETIAIVDAYNDPTIQSDLHAFDQQFGISEPAGFFTKASPTGTLPASDPNWAVEESLDVEWAHAMAPGAKILLVEAKSASLNDLLSAVKYAADQPGVAAVSMSWGGGDFSGETALDSYFTTPAGHGGVTFIAASGDSGAWYGTSWPASSPNVLAVGGVVLPGASPTTSPPTSSVEVTGVPVHATAGEAFSGIVATITGTDPTTTASSFTATIDWGNGTTSSGTITADANGDFDISGTNTYAQPGYYRITVTVQDASSGAALGAATTRAWVKAVPPSILPRGVVFDATAGVAFTGTVATFTSNNSAATPANFTATINWGDGTTSAGAVVVDANGGFDVQGTHTYTTATQSDQGSSWAGFDPDRGPFGDHGYVVTVTINDTLDNSTATAISLARVAPAPSPITATRQNFTAVSGQSFTGLVATFTDSNTSAAAGDFTVTIDWGDGTTSAGTVVADPNGGFDVQGTRTYSQAFDWWDGWGDWTGWGHHPQPANSFQIVTVHIVDTKTQDQATARSLATISPASTGLEISTQNFTGHGRYTV
jgi:hypothetical protein